MKQINDFRQVTVDTIYPFGIFVSLDDGTSGYIRRRELSWDRRIDPLTSFTRGQCFQAAIIGSQTGQTVELSRRLALPNPWIGFAKQYRVGDRIEGQVRNVHDNEIYVEVAAGIEGMVPLDQLSDQPLTTAHDLIWPGDWIAAEIVRLDANGARLELSVRELLAQDSRIAELVHSFFRSSGAERSSDTAPSSRVHDVRLDDRATDLSQLGKILIVDDNEQLLAPFAYWLRARGCGVHTASTGVEAENMLAQHHYDLLIVDIELEVGCSGLSFIEKHRNQRPNSKVIVMSIPSNIHAHLEKIIDLDVCSIFSKPLDMDEVETILLEVCAGVVHGIVPPDEIPDTAVQSDTSALVPLEDQDALAAQIRQMLTKVIEQTGAENAILFRRNTGSGSVEILHYASNVDHSYGATDMLHESPVNDVIAEQDLVVEKKASARAKKFQNLFALLDFESCIGLPVTSGHEDDHALFLFHPHSHQFTASDREQAIATATHLGAILDRISLNERIRFLDKMMLHGQLASGFAHEIYNQLSALTIQVRNLVGLFQQQNGHEAERGEDSIPCAMAATMTHELSDLTNELMGTATSFRLSLQSGKKGAETIQKVLDDACTILRATAARNRVTITVADIPPTANIQVDGDIVPHIFLNIMLNSVQHIAEMTNRRGCIEVTVRYEQGSARPVQIRFADNGPGIHRRLWERIFQPGFSTRTEGTGWGLHIVRTLTRSIGGQVRVEKSIMQVGTTFLVEFPAIYMENCDHVT